MIDLHNEYTQAVLGLTGMAVVVVGPLLWRVATLLARRGTIHGRVVHVCDGDTIVLHHGFWRTRIRLAGIDAPELEQDYGRESLRVLRQAVEGRRVTAHVIDNDRYRRVVARIELDGMDVGLMMIREGLAWPYYHYLPNLDPTDADAYKAARFRARREHRGLWSSPQPEAPWKWRERQRGSASLLGGFLRWLFNLLFGWLRGGR